MERVEELLLEKAVEKENAQLIVFNDDFNFMSWVIASLREVCGHSMLQAEQLTIIIHFKGRACVKTAPYDDLRPLKASLIERGISATIER